MSKLKQIKIKLYKFKCKFNNILILFIRRIFLKNKDREYTSFMLAEEITTIIYPKYRFSEFGRIWLEDENFFHYYEKYEKNNYHSVDRKFFLKSLLLLIKDLRGDTAECGVYLGASSELICEAIKDQNKKHHIFDSFEDLSKPSKEDGSYWKKGDLKADLELVKKNLVDYDFVEYHKGWIPEKFQEVAHKKFCFVHIDVDLHQPTLDSLAFFYPRMVSGGIILCDDYGFSTCPGAKKSFDEFMKDKSESIIHVPTGQCFIIKK